MYLKKLGLYLMSGALAVSFLAGCNGEDNDDTGDDHEEQDMEIEEEGNE
jgi:hypothetical protein